MQYPLAHQCLSVSLIMSTEEVWEEALLNIMGLRQPTAIIFVNGYHLCLFEVNVG